MADGKINATLFHSFPKGAEHVAVNRGAEPADAEGLSVYHEDGEPDQRAAVKVPTDRIGQEDARQQKLSGIFFV